MKTRIVRTSRGWVPQVAEETTTGWIWKRTIVRWSGIDSFGIVYSSSPDLQLRYCVFGTEEEAKKAIERLIEKEERKKKERKDWDILSLD